LALCCSEFLNCRAQVVIGNVDHIRKLLQAFMHTIESTAKRTMRGSWTK
jgi:hypothetical protein